MHFVFFFQAEDGIRDATVTGVQTCALPISPAGKRRVAHTGWSAPAYGPIALVRAWSPSGAGVMSGQRRHDGRPGSVAQHAAVRLSPASHFPRLADQKFGSDRELDSPRHSGSSGGPIPIACAAWS